MHSVYKNEESEILHLETNQYFQEVVFLVTLVWVYFLEYYFVKDNLDINLVNINLVFYWRLCLGDFLSV